MTAGSVTVNKDFKVKHGLSVTEGGTFGQAVVVGTPTENTHATTKLYVDSKPVLVDIEATPPLTGTNGQLYLDSVTGRVAIYYNDTWITLANFEDTVSEIPQHIHDTSIGGTGLITSTVLDAGYYNEGSGTPDDAGYYNTNSWLSTLDGGIAIDNFN